MRVLIVNDLYGPSSAAGVAVGTARALVERGHDVAFAATVQEKGKGGTFREPSGLDVHLIETDAYDLRWRSWRSLWNRRAVRGLAGVIDAVQPDVVHFHNVHIHFSYRALAVAARAGVAVVLSVHDVMPFCFQKMFCFVHEGLAPNGPPISFRAPMPRCIPCARFRYNPIRNAWIKRHFRRYVTRLLAVSDEMARALRENGIENVETLANGIDPRGATTSRGGEEFRARHGLTGRKVVLYGGRLDHRKGAEHLIRAMAQVRERLPTAALLVVGSSHGGYEDRMVDLAHSLGLGDAMVTTGWLDQDEMARAYEAADVICTPSLIFESFGLINAEGMLRGKPAVTAYFGGPKDVVEDGVSGYHVNPLHVDELVDRIGRLLADDGLRERMGRAARERILTRFSLPIQAERLERLYASLGRTQREPAPVGSAAS